jgi:hypothetical protein
MTLLKPFLNAQELRKQEAEKVAQAEAKAAAQKARAARLKNAGAK